MKKDLSYYAALPYRIALYPAEEGGFVAEIADLPGCITQGDTAEDAIEMINDAKICWLSSALENADVIPEPATQAKYSGKIALRIPAALHKRVAEMAIKEGVSVNTQLIALLAESLGAIKERTSEKIKINIPQISSTSIATSTSVKTETSFSCDGSSNIQSWLSWTANPERKVA